MAEPTSTATAVTIASAAVSTSALTAFGVPLGLRADVLLAGFLGSLIAIILLNTVPGNNDPLRDMVRLAFRRMAVAGASSLTAGYLTPLVLLVANVPESVLLSMACIVGAGAQSFLRSFIGKYLPKQGQAEGG